MKKAICLVLVLVLTAGLSASALVMPDMSGAFGFEFETFRAQAEALYKGTLLTGEWYEETEDDSPWSTFTYAEPEAGASVTAIESEGEGVMVFELYAMIPANGTMEETTAAAQKLGSLFGMVIVTSYYVENSTLPEDFVQQFANETTALFSKLYELDSITDEQLKTGVTNVGTVCSYPCSLTIVTDGDEEPMLHLVIDVLPVGGTFLEYEE